MEKCILIYDDEETILDICERILTMKGFLVETRLDCENIMEDIALIKPDLILMDLWMPKISGEEAVMIIKNNAQTKDIPVIMISAHHEIEAITQKIEAKGYLKKPFDVPSLVQIIEKNIA